MPAPPLARNIQIMGIIHCSSQLQSYQPVFCPVTSPGQTIHQTDHQQSFNCDQSHHTAQLVLPGLASRLWRKLKFIAFEFCEGSPVGQSTSVHFRGQTTHYLSFSRQLNISTKLQTTFMGLNKVFQFLLVIARLRSDCSRDSEPELTILSPSSCQQSSIVL